jgi:hypothetical protein
MKRKTCQEIEDKLVEYADGELVGEEAAEVAGHVARCEKCRIRLEKLERSLGLAQVIWEDRQAETKENGAARAAGRWRGRLGAGIAAAGIIIGLGIMLIWQGRAGSGGSGGVSRSGGSAGLGRSGGLDGAAQEAGRMAGGAGRTERSEMTRGEIIRLANRAELAARLLAMADNLKEMPEGESLARERYMYLAGNFGDMEQAKQAKLRLFELEDRRIKQ